MGQQSHPAKISPTSQEVGNLIEDFQHHPFVGFSSSSCYPNGLFCH